jgi:hypothetical protein
VDGLAQLHVGKFVDSLRRNVRRRWIYPPFQSPPLHICNQEERNPNNEVVGVEARVGEKRREAMSEEEDKVSVTSVGRISISRSQIPNTQVRG